MDQASEVRKTIKDFCTKVIPNPPDANTLAILEMVDVYASLYAKEQMHQTLTDEVVGNFGERIIGLAIDSMTRSQKEKFASSIFMNTGMYCSKLLGQYVKRIEPADCLVLEGKDYEAKKEDPDQGACTQS